MSKTLYLLIGPKGSGKTHIGALIHQHTDITFIRVEPIWLGLEPNEDEWKKVEAMVDEIFQAHDKLMIESLGVGDGFLSLHSSLAKKYSIKMIHVFADLGVCFARVKNRNRHDHIPVPDEKVLEYNQIAATVTYDWDLEIDNNAPKPDAEILAAFQSL